MAGSLAEIFEPVLCLHEEGGAGVTYRINFSSHNMSAIRWPRIKTDPSMIAVWSTDRVPAGRAK